MHWLQCYIATQTHKRRILFLKTLPANNHSTPVHGIHQKPLSLSEKLGLEESLHSRQENEKKESAHHQPARLYEVQYQTCLEKNLTPLAARCHVDKANDHCSWSKNTWDEMA